MWKKATSYALLCAALVVSASAQNAATATGDVLVTMPIQLDGGVKNLQLMRGETIEDAAVSFARNHGLLANSDAARVRAVVDQLSGMLRGHIAETQGTQAATPAEAAPKPTVQLSMDLTINGVTRELKKFEGESVETAVERFLYEGELTMSAMRELYPQVVDIVLAKLEQLHPARKELFSFTLTIDGREATARHFEGGNPMEEARETFRSVGITDNAYIEQLAPQIASEINRRIAATQAPERPPTPPAQPSVQSPPHSKELFSVPLTVNERPTILVHYEGYTSHESAVRYLNENGLASADSVDRMLAQLIPIIDNRIAEIAQEKALQEAAVRAEAEADARVAAEETARVAAKRQPRVSLSVGVGNDQTATLEYFEGDSVERTVELFLKQVGMPEGPAFTQSAVQLADAVRVQLAVEQSESTPPQQQTEEVSATTATRAEPYVQLPVTLGGRVFDLLYFEGEQIATTANTFCVEKYEIVRTELGMQFDGEQLLECKTMLEKTLHNLIAQKQAQQQRQQQQNEPQSEPVAAPQQPPPQQPEAPPAKPRSRGEHLLSLDIFVNDRNEVLDVYLNDDPEQVARAFCDTHKIGHENVAPLVEAIKNQIAELK
jgi:hypothetical protein